MSRVLRAFGILDLCAFFAVVMPEHWMDQAHRFFGMGPLPAEPIVGYLARSASLLYALHGALLVLISYDVDRHWGLIRFLGLAALVHAGVILAIDVAQGIPPLWWRYGEAPCYAATGALILWLQRRAEPRKA
ncbi:MAG: hypothetical protein ACT4QC_18055 [Planctomycetaceae bacterium]